MACFKYPANFNVSISSNKGATDVINRLNSQSKQCPEQKFAVAGYSQGAGVMHLALGPSDAKMPYISQPMPTLEKSARSKIVAAVMFGDPGFKGTEGPLGVPSPLFADDILKVTRENCAPGDPVSASSSTSI
jgi:cutinase